MTHILHTILLVGAAMLRAIAEFLSKYANALEVSESEELDISPAPPEAETAGGWPEEWAKRLQEAGPIEWISWKMPRGNEDAASENADETAVSSLEESTGEETAAEDVPRIDSAAATRREHPPERRAAPQSAPSRGERPQPQQPHLARQQRPQTRRQHARGLSPVETASAGAAWCEEARDVRRSPEKTPEIPPATETPPINAASPQNADDTPNAPVRMAQKMDLPSVTGERPARRLSDANSAHSRLSVRKTEAQPSDMLPQAPVQPEPVINEAARPFERRAAETPQKESPPERQPAANAPEEWASIVRNAGVIHWEEFHATQTPPASNLQKGESPEIPEEPSPSRSAQDEQRRSTVIARAALPVAASAMLLTRRGSEHMQTPHAPGEERPSAALEQAQPPIAASRLTEHVSEQAAAPHAPDEERRSSVLEQAQPPIAASRLTEHVTEQAATPHAQGGEPRSSALEPAQSPLAAPRLMEHVTEQAAAPHAPDEEPRSAALEQAQPPLAAPRLMEQVTEQAAAPHEQGGERRSSALDQAQSPLAAPRLMEHVTEQAAAPHAPGGERPSAVLEQAQSPLAAPRLMEPVKEQAATPHAPSGERPSAALEQAQPPIAAPRLMEHVTEQAATPHEPGGERPSATLEQAQPPIAAPRLMEYVTEQAAAPHALDGERLSSVIKHVASPVSAMLAIEQGVKYVRTLDEQGEETLSAVFEHAQSPRSLVSDETLEEPLKAAAGAAEAETPLQVADQIQAWHSWVKSAGAVTWEGYQQEKTATVHRPLMPQGAETGDALSETAETERVFHPIQRRWIRKSAAPAEYARRLFSSSAPEGEPSAEFSQSAASWADFRTFQSPIPGFKKPSRDARAASGFSPDFAEQGAWPELPDLDMFEEEPHMSEQIAERERTTRIKREQRGDLWSVSHF